MWVIALYLLFGIMTWVVYDKAAAEMDEEKSDAFGMVTLIAAWPVYWYMWFRDRDYEDGS